LATDTTCEISDDDIKAWWNAFINRNADAVDTGLVKGDALFIFGVDEQKAPSGIFRGNVDLSSGNINRVIGPAINTLAETKQFAEFETNSSAGTYAFIRKHKGGIIDLNLQERYTDLRSTPILNYEHSHGQWFCIPANELESKDTIEFGAKGVRDFETKAVWNISK
jgi:hypothetical protein